MLRIQSDERYIDIHYSEHDPMINVMCDLRQSCIAVLGSLGYAHGIPLDKMVGGFLVLFEDEEFEYPKPVIINDREEPTVFC